MSETITRNDLKAILEEVGRDTAIVDSALNSTSENPVQNKVITNALNNKMNTSELIDLVYPVGSIYMSMSSTHPATLFGGEWEPINGRFLVAQGDNGASGYEALNLTAGDTGGEKEHLVTGDEAGLKAHTHPDNFSIAGSGQLTSNGGGSHAHKLRLNDVGASGSARNIPVSTSGLSNSTFTDTVANHTHTIDSHGHTLNGSVSEKTKENATSAHNNMPPYLAVYMWKRIT